jgi:hypothetical protein
MYAQLSSVSEDPGIYSRTTAANIVDVRMKEKWQRDQKMAMKGMACAVQLATVLVLVTYPWPCVDGGTQDDKRRAMMRTGPKASVDCLC